MADRSSGFTLIEVLVALAIVGIMFAGVGALSHRSSDQALQLEERLAAHQLSWNLMEEFRMEGAPRTPPETRGEETMGRWKLQWARRISHPEESMRYKVEINVGKKGEYLASSSWYWSP